jgi:hypothetical protein
MMRNVCLVTMQCFEPIGDLLAGLAVDHLAPPLPLNNPQIDGRAGGILSEGMAMIARELIELVRERYRVRLSESVALYALITGAIPANGRRRMMRPRCMGH